MGTKDEDLSEGGKTGHGNKLLPEPRQLSGGSRIFLVCGPPTTPVEAMTPGTELSGRTEELAAC